MRILISFNAFKGTLTASEALDRLRLQAPESEKPRTIVPRRATGVSALIAGIGTPQAVDEARQRLTAQGAQADKVKAAKDKAKVKAEKAKKK